MVAVRWIIQLPRRVLLGNSEGIKRAGAELDPGPFRCLVSLLHPAKLPLGRLLYTRHAGPRGDDRSYFLGIEVDRAFSPLRRREQQIGRSADSRVPDNLPYHLVDGRASVVSVFVCNYLPCLGTHLLNLKVDWLFAVVGVDLYPHHGGPLAFVGFSASSRKVTRTKARWKPSKPYLSHI